MTKGSLTIRASRIIIITIWLSIWVNNTDQTTYGIETNTGLKHAEIHKATAQRQNTTVATTNDNNNTKNTPLISDAVLAAIIGAIIGGAIGFLASIATRILDWRNRPLISIKEETTDVYNEGQFLTKIRVENIGKSAAENCKASLRHNDYDLKVAWENLLLTQITDSTITINADDWEYTYVNSIITVVAINVPLHWPNVAIENEMKHLVTN
ncbi:MAG: hypothetical protein WAM14_03775 [Candidatus Nitrosopolaris sp.]